MLVTVCVQAPVNTQGFWQRLTTNKVLRIDKKNDISLVTQLSELEREMIS